MDRKKQIEEWVECKRAAARYAELELELRNKLVADLFDNGKLEGADTRQINDIKITCTKRLNYSVNKEKAQALSADPVYADLFSWSPTLRVGEYRKAESKLKAGDVEFMRNLQEVVTIKPGQASLEVK